MVRARATATAGLLAVEAGLAVLGVLVHYVFTAEYGDVTQTTAEALRSAMSGNAVAVVLVAVAALVVYVGSGQRWARVAALTIPVLMVTGILIATPVALRQKLVTQYATTPQCVTAEDVGPGPEGERQAQQAFESIEHIGHFGGPGVSGVDGCARRLVLTEDADVLKHYRAALPQAGWRVVEDDERHLRAERAGMAFEVTICGRGGVVWAGEASISGQARCGQVH